MRPFGPLSGWSWAAFLARWVVGLIFAMAGFWKVFELTPAAHARRYFLEGYADTWIPLWLLWALGVAIPFVELAAGALLCLGLRVRAAAVALAFVLIVVTYGHLLAQPLFDTTSHIFPRTVLVLVVLVAPPEEDRLSLDALLGRRSAG
ncbi:MAG: DoxX family membrane protein [Thermoanaerobaculia bacterium]